MRTFDPNYQHSKILFKVGQKVVVFNDKNEILFLRRSEKCTRAGGWDFPGGGLEDNEQPVDGIKRETQEECGILIDRVRPVASIVHDSEENGSKTLTIGYIAELKRGEVQLSWEHDVSKWLSLNEALKVELPPLHLSILKSGIEYRKKNKF